jgi:hypothetical protein
MEYNDLFSHMQKLAFGKPLSESMTKSEFKQKIKEIVLDEAKKKKKQKDEPTDILPPEEEVSMSSTIEEPTDMISPEPSTDMDINPTVKSIQDSLQKAYTQAKQLGDEKLVNQIGNTITMLVRTQILGGQ